MAIECFIIENHPLNVEILKLYIKRTPFLRFLGSIESWDEYYNLNIIPDILLINIDPIYSITKQLHVVDKVSYLVIWISKLSCENFDIIQNSEANFTAGFLRTPITYKLFIEEIERLIK